MFGLGTALRGTDQYGGNLVALPAHNFEAESIEVEDLADLGYLPRFIEQQPGDGRRLFVGKTPAKFPVEIA